MESIMDSTTQELYFERLQHKIEYNQIEVNVGVEKAWNKKEKNIMEAARKALGKWKINIHKQKHDKPWLPKEIENLAKINKKIKN